MWFDINTIMVPPRKPKQSLCAGTQAEPTVTASQEFTIKKKTKMCVLEDNVQRIPLRNRCTRCSD